MAFFYAQKKKGSTKKRKEEIIPLRLLHERECSACYLNPREDELDTPKFSPSGPVSSEIYVLGSHPSKNEDSNGKHFSGDTTSLLRNYIPSRYKRHVRYNFTSRCHPLSDKDSHRVVQIECCRPSIIKDIEDTKPKVIIGAGALVMAWMMGRGGDLNVWRGRQIPVKIGSHLCWYVPVYDPTFVYLEGKIGKNKQRYDSKYDEFYRRDLKMVCDGVEAGDFNDVPWVNTEDADANCSWVKGHSETDFRKVRRFLEKAAQEDIVAVDLETTDLRPYSGGRILTCSVTTEESTLAFPLQHKKGWRAWNREYEDKTLDLLRDFIINSGDKIWHNMGFDTEWLHYFFGPCVFINQRHDDSMIAAYLIDSRKGMLSLDTLVRIYLGLPLKAQSDIDRKNVESEDFEKTLRYNALDTKYTYKLFFILEEILDSRKLLRPNYEEMLRSASMLVLCQDRGLLTDSGRMAQFEEQFKTEIEKVNEQITRFTNVKRFKRQKGYPLQTSSNTDVAYLFDTVLDLKHGRKYKGKDKKKWSYSTDEGVLNNVIKDTRVEEEPREIAKLVLKHRTASKMLSTYVEGIHASTHTDGLLHTSYSQIYTSTGRLNSSDPNNQNWPKRKMKVLREIVTSPDLFSIVSADYGQIEARVFAMASKDKNFVDALWSGYDVHQAWALKIIEAFNDIFDIIAGKYELRNSDFNSPSDFEKAVIKCLRNDTKNGWVFPQFFGSSPYSCASNMNIPNEVATKLATEFWDTFSGVKKWQEKTVEFYNKNGYVETLTGKRRGGPLSYNEVINTPIQGTASTIVVNGMNVLSEMALEEKHLAHLQPNLNVHDDITLYLPDTTLDDDINIIANVMTDSRFDFINVPLVVEVEVGKNWGSQKVYGEYSSDTGWNKA